MVSEVSQIDSARIDYTDIPAVKGYITLLLNAIEHLSSELNQARELIGRLKDENARLKGGNPKPEIKPNSKPKQEKEDREKKEKEKEEEEEEKKGEEEEASIPALEPRTKLPRRPVPKTEDLPIVKIVEIPVDKDTLPPDAEYKGVRTISVPTIEIKVGRIVFRIERYYSKAQNKVYEGKLPEEYQGQKHSPEARAFIIEQYFGLGVTENKILNYLLDKGFPISAGKISDILIDSDDLEIFHKEKDETHEASIAHSPYQQMDDSGARVSGKNQYCSVLCNEFCSLFSINPKKNRLTVIDILLGPQELKFLLNDKAVEHLKEKKLPRKYFDPLEQELSEKVFSEKEFGEKIDKLFPKIPGRYRDLISEAAAISYYKSLPPEKKIDILVSDDARQFQDIAEHHGLCWIHAERHFGKLMPVFKINQKTLEDFRKGIWDYYQRLKDYKKNPNPYDKQALLDAFDELFIANTDYDDLNHRIELTAANKDKLLVVLDHPCIPLHNNTSELAERLFVIKRKISIQTRSEKGTKAWETMLSLYDSCRKLNISFSDYVYDRICRRNKIPRLADLIAERYARGHPT